MRGVVLACVVGRCDANTSARTPWRLPSSRGYPLTEAQGVSCRCGAAFDRAATLL